MGARGGEGWRLGERGGGGMNRLYLGLIRFGKGKKIREKRRGRREKGGGFAGVGE